MMDAARYAYGSDFMLDYIAPIGMESDHVTVWS